jgi:hypothetical protein
MVPEPAVEGMGQDGGETISVHAEPDLAESILDSQPHLPETSDR